MQRSQQNDCSRSTTLAFVFTETSASVVSVVQVASRQRGGNEFQSRDCPLYMGASDWAGRMCRDLEDEFGICGDRALRLTTLIRYFHQDGYRELLGERDTDEYDRRWRRLQADLPEELRAQDGETIEERWNELMDDMDAQARAERGVYLIPWGEYDTEEWTDPGVTTTRPE